MRSHWETHAPYASRVSQERCLFAVRGAGAIARLPAIERFYGRAAVAEQLGEGQVMVGAIGRGADTADFRRGARFAAATLVSNGRDVELTTEAAGPTSLYRARGQGVEVWSTHASAASLLAHDRLEIDVDAIGEYLAAQFAGGTGTVIANVEAVPPATTIEVSADAVRVSASTTARWGAIPPSDAEAAATEALLAGLGEALRDVSPVWCGLTAGLDSQVAAAALRERGISAAAFTWAFAADGETGGAARAAEYLGIEHRLQGYDLRDDEDARAAVVETARWTDGAAAVGFGEPSWPEPIGAFVTGGGGEVGRAFYWRWFARAWPDAAPTHMAQLLSGLLEARIAGARIAARVRLREDVREWVARAEAEGARGWQIMDAVYADQRMRHWGRAMMPRRAFPLVAAFGSHEVSLALSSLPVEEKLRDRFHRRFLADRGLGRPDPAPPRRAPKVARRVAWAWRRCRGLPPLAPSGLRDEWNRRPRLHAWLADDVLGGELVDAAMGSDWATTMRDRFLAGDAYAEQIATWAGGPVALLEACAGGAGSS